MGLEKGLGTVTALQGFYCCEETHDYGNSYKENM